MKSQTERVYDYLKIGPLTSMDAYKGLGCVHLPRRIMDLKELGVGIHTESVKGVNRYGSPVHYNVYSLTGTAAPTSFVKSKKVGVSSFIKGVMFAGKQILEADPSFKGTPGALKLLAELRRLHRKSA